MFCSRVPGPCWPQVEMANIQNRSDIQRLVRAFYAQVRQDDLLGPIFNRAIPEPHWPEHLEKLTDFWETNLLGVLRYKGSPTRAHVEVDAREGHQISQLHFHRWLSLWFATLDSLFDGPLAQRAKDGARRMATGQFMAIGSHRI